MANIQKQIEQFDDIIRLKTFDEDELLREKRDRVLNKLRSQFENMRKDGIDVPSFRSFNQGSYEMRTGIVPAEGDFDIDVGIAFNVNTSDVPDPVQLKKYVHDALDGHTNIGVTVRRPCVTIFYTLEGEQAYHVDLAIYGQKDTESENEQLFLAKGMLESIEENRFWEPSNPKGFLKWVKDRFNDKEAEQFRRVIRALKRWKSEKFKSDGNSAPTGISLTVAAGLWFKPQITVDSFTNVSASNDVLALKNFVIQLLARFSVDNRLVVNLPVIPHNDLFEKMSDTQMTSFKSELESLRDSLEMVIAEADPIVACEIMQDYFSDEFPVPEKEKTAQSRGRAISSSGTAA